MTMLLVAVGAINSAPVGPPVITAEITASLGTPSALTGDGSVGNPWTASVSNLTVASITVTLTSDQSETFTDVHVSGTDLLMTLAIVDGHNMTCIMSGSSIRNEQRKITFTSVSTGQTTDVWIELTSIGL